MLFSLVKALVILAALVIAGTTMYVTTIIAMKLGVGGEKGAALGCLAAIVALAVSAVVSFQLLDTWLSGG